MAWFPISCALCHSQSIIHATSKKSTCFGCHCAPLDAIFPFVTFTSTNYLDVFVDLSVIFYHNLTILINVIHIHSNGNILPPLTYLRLLYVNLEFSRHQSTFFSRFHNLFSYLRYFVCCVIKVFYRLVCWILNNAIERFIITLRLNWSILIRRALKTDFSQVGTKITKIVQFEEGLKVEKAI